MRDSVPASFATNASRCSNESGTALATYGGFLRVSIIGAVKARGLPDHRGHVSDGRLLPARIADGRF